MLRYDKRIAPFRITDMENRFLLPVTINNGTESTVYLFGYIDRVDHIQEGIRVIGYKTGSDLTGFGSIGSLFDKLNPNRNKAAFQILLYCLMFNHAHNSTTPLIPGIYNTKLLLDRNYDYHLKCDKTHINDFRDVEEEFTQKLTELLKEIFLSGIPFCQTTNEKKCHSCQYAGICRKQI